MSVRLSVFIGIVTTAVLPAQSYNISLVAGANLPPLPAPGQNISIGNPLAVGTDAAGNVFFMQQLLYSNTGDGIVYKVSPDGLVSIVAGDGHPTNSGDGGAAVDASIGNSLPNDIPFSSGLAIDANQNIYIVSAALIRKISPSGIITTVAGTGCGEIAEMVDPRSLPNSTPTPSRSIPRESVHHRWRNGSQGRHERDDFDNRRHRQ